MHRERTFDETKTTQMYNDAATLSKREIYSRHIVNCLTSQFPSNYNSLAREMSHVTALLSNGFSKLYWIKLLLCLFS